MGITRIEDLSNTEDPQEEKPSEALQPPNDFDQEFEDRKARELAEEHEKHLAMMTSESKGEME